VQVLDLELGLQVDVVFDVGAHPVALDLPVLREEHEHAEDDRLERHAHRQEAEGEGVEVAERRRRQRLHVEDDPHEEQADVDEEERQRPGEIGDPIGDLHDGGALVLLDRVGVAGRRVAEEERGLAEALAGRGQEVEGGVRLEPEELVEVTAVDLDGLDVLQRGAGRGAGAEVEEADLAEEVADLGALEHHLLAGLGLDPELGRALAEHVHRVAGVAEREHRLARLHPHDLDALGEDLALVVVEEREEGHLGEHLGVGRHERMYTARPHGSKSHIPRPRALAPPRRRRSRGMRGGPSAPRHPGGDRERPPRGGRVGVGVGVGARPPRRAAGVPRGPEEAHRGRALGHEDR
jgi:hypothetical protein